MELLGDLLAQVALVEEARLPRDLAHGEVRRAEELRGAAQAQRGEVLGGAAAEGLLEGAQERALRHRREVREPVDAL